MIYNILMNLKPADFFELNDTPFKTLFDGCEYVWDGLKNIKAYLSENLQPNIPKVFRLSLLKSGPGIRVYLGLWYEKRTDLYSFVRNSSVF